MVTVSRSAPRHDGRCRATRSSRPRRPRSTCCITSGVVASTLVSDARSKIVSSRGRRGAGSKVRRRTPRARAAAPRCRPRATAAETRARRQRRSGCRCLGKGSRHSTRMYHYESTCTCWASMPAGPRPSACSRTSTAASSPRRAAAARTCRRPASSRSRRCSTR